MKTHTCFQERTQNPSKPIKCVNTTLPRLNKTTSNCIFNNIRVSNPKLTTAIFSHLPVTYGQVV